ncbi:uncharacterized protein EI97DRAFT_343814, partial [Westerdykella ornata]
VSTDTIGHSDDVMDCRFGFGPLPETGEHTTGNQPFINPKFNLPSFVATPNKKRFHNCAGRLYHQLSCSHRIRTDIVEECGTNCVEPFQGRMGLPFCCQECLDQQYKASREQLETGVRSMYSGYEEISWEEYEAWFNAKEASLEDFERSWQAYVRGVRSETRPSHVASARESEPEDLDLAGSLGCISLERETPTVAYCPPSMSLNGQRVSLATDPPEQLRFNLELLSL